MSVFPSICIPRVSKNTTREDIIKVFSNCLDVKVKQVDMAYSENQARVFVHFSEYNPNDIRTSNTREALLSGETLKIIYKAPWYWRFSISRFAQK